MTGTYHHVALLSRMPALRGRPAHYEIMGQPVERVVSLSVQTDQDSGLIHCLMAIDMLMDGMPPEGDRIAIYPFSQQTESQEDAIKVAKELGYRLRRATAGVGWEWVDPTVVIQPTGRDDLVIGA